MGGTIQCYGWDYTVLWVGLYSVMGGTIQCYGWDYTVLDVYRCCNLRIDYQISNCPRKGGEGGGEGVVVGNLA